jgi:molybdate transport system ATP-binding protein
VLSVDIRKNLGIFQLDVSFETDGEVLGILGASGCGKSMTLKCIAGIEKPDEGTIMLNGRVLFSSRLKIDLPPQERRVGYLFQQHALFPKMTVEQNIMAGCREKDRNKKNEAVKEKIRSMRLTGLEKMRPHQLSGGQRQRVALARILINEPELLLLDEPLAALDDYLKWQLELELADIIKSFGRGAVFVSHSRDEVYRLCDSVCVLDCGKSEEKQSVKELFGSPGTLAACLLSGCKNFSRIQSAGNGRVEALDWGAYLSVPSVPADAQYAGIRPHYIRLSDMPECKNSILCTVEKVVENVFSTIVMLATPGGREGWSLLRAELGKDEWRKLEGRRDVYALIEPEDVMLLRNGGSKEIK